MPWNPPPQMSVMPFGIPIPVTTVPECGRVKDVSMVDDLDLSDDQINELKGVAKTFQKNVGVLQEDLRNRDITPKEFREIERLSLQVSQLHFLTWC